MALPGVWAAATTGSLFGHNSDSSPAVPTNSNNGPDAPIPSSASARSAAEQQQHEDEAQRELNDAIESLRHARLQQENILRDLEKKRGAEGTAKLESAVENIREELSQGAHTAGRNTTVMRSHIVRMKEEVTLMNGEAGRLHRSVELLREGCAISSEEVQRLREKLRDVNTEKEQLAQHLRLLLNGSRESVEKLRVSMMKQDKEIARLREQNDFMRLQLLQHSTRYI